MKRIVLLFAMVVLSLSSFAQVVTNIQTEYHHGQTFVTWDTIPNYQYPFYYVYRYDYPITSANINNATYLGKIPLDFSFNYFLNLGILNPPNVNFPRKYYCVYNNDPWEVADSSMDLFVATCDKNKPFYYAVTADSTTSTFPFYQENRHIVPGANATTTPVQEHVAPINAYLQLSGYPLQDNQDLLYNAYAVFGGNVKTQYTPLFANEGCLIFNWGLIEDADTSNTPKNAATFFFYGGGGNAYQNANGTNVSRMWKVSLEDDIPNFNWDDLAGENTKWIGYNENFDVYNANNNSPAPSTGVDRTYTISRVNWTYDWLMRTFHDKIDSTQISAEATSSGCTGALMMAYLYPDKVAAVDVTNAKFNLEYLNDDNPHCKWNTNGTSRNKANIYLGAQSTNLPSDVPKIKGTGNYTLWDLTNSNNIISDNKYNSLPVMFVTSGKEDDVTCWEEKIPFYKSNQQNRTGTFFYWDLRSHKGGVHEIKDRPLELVLRYRTNLSYPAFANCSANDDPGDTNNPVDPFYDGDSVGTMNGTLDWVDTSIHETPTSWQTKIFAHQFLLVDGITLFPTYLPTYVKTDITPRRLQQFVNIPDGSSVHLENWNSDGTVLIQSKIITYHLNADGEGLMTFKKAKISHAGNIIKFYVLLGPKDSPENINVTPLATDMVYPNPTEGLTSVDLSLLKDEEVTVSVVDIMGKQMLYENRGLVPEGDQELPVDLSRLPQGIYLINVQAGLQSFSYKVIKQ
ncbi:MAG TPA: T9SS type A sorting domain-containing protein [Chitinophagales bacterium]|nr:T9SS type A sorting domain-containing protein [Chitinophagales bacterium]